MSGIPSKRCPFVTSFLTYSSDHQELPEKQQEVGHFIEHHDPAGQTVTGGVSSLANVAADGTLFYSTNLTMFLMRSMKAFLAETQKFFP